ncbi:MATE family efflux transporter [Paracoccus luteus]|uniref:MATE family efflux transporter n=1 Tax=Paracoccus luteus TaxID=2508543 RepID=UPI00106F5800|nr:MATE family efflux transporter [Paracoccus luteus]
MPALLRLRPELIATAALGLPLVGSHLARMMIGVTDTLMIGRTGVEPLAALVLANSYFHILTMLGSGYGLVVLGLIAAARARGDDVEARRVTRMALWLSLIHSLAVAPLFWWSGAILTALGQEPQIAALGQDYLRIMAWAMPATLFGMVLNSFLAALGRANMVLAITVAALPLNAGLNWVLIFGKLGLPPLGVTGAALASASVIWVQVGALAACAALLPVARRYHLFLRLWRADWTAFRAVLAMGLPIGLTLVAESGMFTGANVMMGWFGAVPLAAHGIALQITAVTFMVHLGISNAATIRVGSAHGAGDADGLRDAALAAVVLSAALALVPVFLFIVAPGPLIAVYLNPADPNGPAILVLAAALMLYAALFQMVDAMQVIALGLLRGVQDTRVPMMLAIVSYWLVGLPAGWLLAFPLGLGPAGLWLGLLVGLSCAAAALMARFWGRGRTGWRAGAVPGGPLASGARRG